MSRIVFQKTAITAAAVSVFAWSSSSMAEDGGMLSNLWGKTSINAAVRTDFAVRTTSITNTYNQNNSPYQFVDVARQAYVPPTLTGGLFGTLPGTNWTVPIPGANPGAADTVRRADFIPNRFQNINYLTERFSTEIDTKFSDKLQFIGRIRGIYSPTSVYDGFNAADVANEQGGISGGGGYRGADTGKPNYFGQKARNGENINPIELSGRNYEVDFPTLLLDYKDSNYDIRVGNQTIAWGQAIFLQTFDVPNGLDLRRHLILDRAIEEFEDKRTPELSARATMQVNQNLLVDGFIAKFQPDVLPNPNTSYNVIPSQFYKPLDNYYQGSTAWQPDGGFRVKSDYGTWGYSAFFSSRLHPLGVFRWAESGINKGLTGTNKDGTTYGNLLGTEVQTAYNAKLPNCGATYTASTCRLYGSVGEALSHTPFTVGPAGVYTGQEYYSSAGQVRLDARKTVNAAVNEFPALRDVYASNTANTQETINELDTFFLGSGGSLRGNVQRDYRREENLGLGGSIVTDSSIGALNEIIVNFEGQFTPHRTYTNPSLSEHFLHANEYILTATAEKWTRWTDAFPAAYLVFEFQHRSDSDLVGLNLKGYGGSDRETAPKDPTGISSADYAVFAGFQPTPNRKFVFEWAFLWDVRGGLLAQPEVQYNIGHGFIGELFYNYTNGHLYGNPLDNLVRAIDADDEVAMRLTYQF